ncbi:hypothetical protein C9374_011753 [Naegleria lovaniensis]|uniref:NADH:flavin oxidoreductase/NADH oxidase N-terminal domain-containing protein n=1 Tax=Naegleria lovaniensis TaxID=51637 RepID=A0AA88GES7_NAELO|nr:uncharacterized protein C9374_011753 [Naegleria lovaniensis]KAG2373868.1 hypothetical protein C9374_011753 [Naegleria lovaniensis]
MSSTKKSSEIAKKLFTSLQLGGNTPNSKIQLSHRVVMPPLTRSRAVVGHGELHPELGPLYYSQRATEGGLLISEASQISKQGEGYPTTPGIYNKEHIESWSRVTKAVHDKGGIFFLQTWHVGRLREIVKQFGQAARNAKLAGFDGVELHSANGYLIDQFIQDGTNQRKDEYGGSISNRLRFLQEVVEESIKAFGGDSSKVSVRLSPETAIYEMSDSTPKETWREAVKLLAQYDLAYLHLVEPQGAAHARVSAELKPHYNKKSPIVVNSGFNLESAEKILQDGHADAVSFGRWFIANPDLVHRLKNNLPLNELDYTTLYYSPNVSGGYTEYKTYEEVLKVQQ